MLAGGTVARTAHFALHRAALNVAVVKPSTSLLPTAPSLALFDVRDVWIGALVPKRWAKRATTRNAIKRQIYSVSIDFEPGLPAAAHVVRLRAGFDRAQFISAASDLLKTAVRQELQQLFTRAAANLLAPAVQAGAS